MFEYLILRLLQLHMIAPYPVASGNRLSFTLVTQDGDNRVKTDYYIIAVDDRWTLVQYTYQHNAPSIVNSIEIITAGDWRRVLYTLKIDWNDVNKQLANPA